MNSITFRPLLHFKDIINDSLIKITKSCVFYPNVEKCQISDQSTESTERWGPESLNYFYIPSNMLQNIGVLFYVKIRLLSDILSKIFTESWLGQSFMLL